MHPDYLEKILTAQVYDVAIESPLDAAPNLSARTGNRIFLKREDMQPVFSFKLRGAYNKIVKLSPEKLKGIPCVMIASGGRTKAQGLRGVLKGGMCDVIITDEQTARSILAMEDT